MKKYFQYLNYVIRHKYYVMIECFKHGVFVRGIMHDLSKLFPDEFFPYVEQFYGKYKDFRDPSGYYDPTKGSPEFQLAWLKHQNRNDHHWQYWILKGDDGWEEIYQMSKEARLEMVCDWEGASKAQGRKTGDILNWYNLNKDKMVLHNETRKWVEEYLGVL